MFDLRLLKRALLFVAALAIPFISFSGHMWAQTAGQPSTSKGDWPYYFADAKGTQILASGSDQRVQLQPA